MATLPLTVPVKPKTGLTLTGEQRLLLLSILREYSDILEDRLDDGDAGIDREIELVSQIQTKLWEVK